jgi:uncharacterized protein HemX
MMETQEPDNTIKEILEDDRTDMRRRKRGKGCLLRLLIIAVLLFIGFYGFIVFRQKMLDMEAEAVVRARQTLSSQADMQKSVESESAPATEVETQSAEPTANPLIERTATVQAQLTSVAEFQLTATPDQ